MALCPALLGLLGSSSESSFFFQTKLSCLQLCRFLNLFPARISGERFKDHFYFELFLSLSVKAGCVPANVIFLKTFLSLLQTILGLLH